MATQPRTCGFAGSEMFTTCNPPDPAATTAKLPERATPLDVPGEQAPLAVAEPIRTGSAGLPIFAICNPDEPAAMNARLPDTATSRASPVAREPRSAGEGGLEISIIRSPAVPAAR